MAKEPTNEQIAEVLERIAEILEADDDNPYRVQAYREGARTVRSLDQPVAKLVQPERLDALTALPTIGRGIASVISEYVLTGRSDVLDQLEGKASPAAVIARVPGIGKELAQRIVNKLHIQSLPELEEAAYDGRLDTVEGFGPRRVEAVRTALAGMLSRSAQSRQRERTGDGKKASQQDEERPSVELLLEIDEEYRRRAEAGDLTTIAPRRFNPESEAWLPVMRTKRQGWDFTVLFSNTAQAHELDKTHDWVVIYYERDDTERQNTVVTETRGSLEGRRVVRGRAAENRRYYEAKTKA